ncbi:MAG: YitT family protein, partial [Bacilli bacterium]
LVPNNMIDGGVIGIALISNELFGHISPLIQFATLVIVFNIPFMYWGYKQIGKTFTVSSIFGIVTLAIMQKTLHSVHFELHDPLLATVFGGLVLGLGVGIVIRYGGSLDGTEILGIILTKRLPFSVGEFVMFFNVAIFTFAGFVFGLAPAMYSVIAYFIAYKTIDAVVQGLDETKAVIIVSAAYQEISDAIHDRLGRGTTKLQGKGGFTDSETEVLYVVITRLEVTKLKGIVYDIDDRAFLTIMNTQETRGAKFKSPIH